MKQPEQVFITNTLEIRMIGKYVAVCFPIYHDGLHKSSQPPFIDFIQASSPQDFRHASPAYINPDKAREIATELALAAEYLESYIAGTPDTDPVPGEEYAHFDGSPWPSTLSNVIVHEVKDGWVRYSIKGRPAKDRRDTVESFLESYKKVV